MTLHKINREKLVEELKSITINDMGDYMRVNIKKPHICTLDPVQVLQAAQNWLTITDPGFDIPFEWADAAATVGMNEKASYADILKAGLQAMIAKAGE